MTTTQHQPAVHFTPEFARALVDHVRAQDNYRVAVRIGAPQSAARFANRTATTRTALTRVQLALGDMRSTFSESAIDEAFAMVGETR